MLRYISWILVLIGIVILLFIFGSAIKQEFTYYSERAVGIRYSVDPIETWSNHRAVNPPNLDFSIVIPKINAAAPIVDNVDPNDSIGYLKALKLGVAHAAGTVYPGEEGNSYFFAHSTDSLFNVGRYNAVFFLMGHLTEGDEIDVFYRGRLFKYTVYDKKVVSPENVEYSGNLIEGEQTIALQTCYPLGTTLKRLVVFAKLDNE